MYKQTERNAQLRKEVEKVIDQFGIKAKHITNMTGLEYTVLSKWRNCKANYSSGNLNKIDHFLGSYRNKY